MQAMQALRRVAFGGKLFRQRFVARTRGHQAHHTVRQGHGDRPGPSGVGGENLHHGVLTGNADGAAGLAVTVGEKRGHSVAAVALRGTVGEVCGGDHAGEAKGKGEHLLGHGRAFLAFGMRERLPGMG